MVEFCPECGNLLRKKPCPCGYDSNKSSSNTSSLNQMWDPPSPNLIYCRITATSFDKLKSMLKKNIVPDILKDIRRKINNHLYSCTDCLYYDENKSLCQKKKKYLSKESICRIFEPYQHKLP